MPLEVVGFQPRLCASRRWDYPNSNPNYISIDDPNPYHNSIDEPNPNPNLYYNSLMAFSWLAFLLHSGWSYSYLLRSSSCHQRESSWTYEIVPAQRTSTEIYVLRRQARPLWSSFFLGSKTVKPKRGDRIQVSRVWIVFVTSETLTFDVTLAFTNVLKIITSSGWPTQTCRACFENKNKSRTGLLAPLSNTWGLLIMWPCS